MPVISLEWLKSEHYDILRPQTEVTEEGKFKHPIIIWEGELRETEEIFLFEVNPEELTITVSQLAEPTKVVEGYNIQSWGHSVFTISLNGNIGPIYRWLYPDSNKRVSSTFVWEQIRKIEKWVTARSDKFEPTLSLFYPYGIHNNREYKGFFSSFKITESAETFNVYNLSAEFIALKIIATEWIK